MTIYLKDERQLVKYAGHIPRMQHPLDQACSSSVADGSEGGARSGSQYRDNRSLLMLLFSLVVHKTLKCPKTIFPHRSPMWIIHRQRNRLHGLMSFAEVTLSSGSIVQTNTPTEKDIYLYWKILEVVHSSPMQIRLGASTWDKDLKGIIDRSGRTSSACLIRCNRS